MCGVPGKPTKLKNTRHNLLKRLASRLTAAMCLCLSLLLSAADFNDGIDRSDPNFVKASLLVTGPGDELFSCVGHSCFRLECPAFNLDYCFSYESEDVEDKIFSFFSGTLTMGMFAIPTVRYLGSREQRERGVVQYPLNLPPAVKQKLWKLLDERVAQGTSLPYDYDKRGCTHALVGILADAIAPHRLEPSMWPEWISKSRREMFDRALSESYPWNLFFIHAIMGTEADKDVSRLDKIIFPNDLVAVLKCVTVEGAPMLGEGIVLGVASCAPRTSCRLTPLIVALLLLGVSIASIWIDGRAVVLAALLLPALIGVFVMYLVMVSNLPNTSWNWLIVPFNVLPLVFWHWRRYWALPFGGLVVVWAAFVLCGEHRLVHPAFVVIAVSSAVLYARDAVFMPCRSIRRGE